MAIRRDPLEEFVRGVNIGLDQASVWSKVSKADWKKEHNYGGGRCEIALPGRDDVQTIRLQYFESGAHEIKGVDDLHDGGYTVDYAKDAGVRAGRNLGEEIDDCIRSELESALSSNSIDDANRSGLLNAIKRKQPLMKSRGISDPFIMMSPEIWKCLGLEGVPIKSSQVSNKIFGFDVWIDKGIEPFPDLDNRSPIYFGSKKAVALIKMKPSYCKRTKPSPGFFGHTAFYNVQYGSFMVFPDLIFQLLVSAE